MSKPVKSKPRLITAKFRKRNRHAMGYTTWKETVCSACERELHETATFCVHCGAQFGKGK